LEALESALASPGDTTTGLARRLIRESPAPSLLSKTPQLSAGQAQEIDLDTSADLFATPKPVSSSPGLPKKRSRHADHQKAADRTFSVPPVTKPTVFNVRRTASNDMIGKQAASTKNTSRSLVQNPATVGVSNSLLRNIANKPPSANVGGVMAKKIPFGVPVNIPQSSLIFREGYNGLGGHDKVVVPPAKSCHPVVGGRKKLVIGGAMRQFFGPSKTAQSPLPSLPSLDETIVIK